MGIVLALAAALAFGVSDFTAGTLSRRVPAFQVATAAQLFSAAGSLLAALVLPWSHVTWGELGLGLLGGVGSAVGTGFLYRGFAVARMNVVAPLSSVCAVLLPLAFGLAFGERPSVLALAGVAAAIPAIWLVARASGPDRDGRRRRGVVEGVAAGLGFGLLFIGYGHAPAAAGLWPLVVGQIASIPMLGAMTVATGLAPLPVAPAMPRAAIVGVLSAVATAAYSLATHEQLLAIAAVITSLYPASTLAMAALWLHERVSAWQACGLACAAAAVTLITVG